MELRHAVCRSGADDAHVGHAHRTLAVLVDERHARDAVRIGRQRNGQLLEEAGLASPFTPGALAEMAGKVEKLLKSGEEWDLTEADGEATRDVLAEREAKLAERLARAGTKKAKTVDPILFALSIAAEDLALYRPVFRWEYDPPTGRQLAYLEKCGISTGAVSCKGMANLLIDKLVRRQNEGLCTPRQIRCLESFGYSNVGSWPFEKASQTITGLARNGWRR